MNQLFERSGLRVTEGMLMAAAENPLGEETMAYLLKRGDVNVTEAELMAAAPNSEQGTKITELLLRERDDGVQMAEGALTLL